MLVGGGTWKYSDEEMIGELSPGTLSEKSLSPSYRKQLMMNSAG
jgi:hypothetical protein